MPEFYGHLGSCRCASGRIIIAVLSLKDILFDQRNSYLK